MMRGEVGLSGCIQLRTWVPGDRPASLLYANDLLSPLPPDLQVQGNGRGCLYIGLFCCGVAGGAGEIQHSVSAERVAVDAVVFEEPYIPQEPSGRGVGAQPEYVLEEARDGCQAAPAYEVVFGTVALGSAFGGVVFPECSGLLEDLYHVVEVFAGDLVRQVLVAGPVEPAQDHVVRRRPHPAEPVAATGIVLGVVGRERGHAMGASERRGVFEVPDKSGDPLLWHYIREQCPEGSHGLDTRERSVGELVVVEGGLFVPQALVYSEGEYVALFAQVSDLVGTTEGVGHLQEQVRRQHLLEARVDPDRVPVVGEALGPSALPTLRLGNPRLVVHPGTEA